MYGVSPAVANVTHLLHYVLPVFDYVRTQGLKPDTPPIFCHQLQVMCNMVLSMLDSMGVFLHYSLKECWEMRHRLH